MTSMVLRLSFILIYTKLFCFAEVVLTVLSDWHKQRGEENEHYMLSVTLPGKSLLNIGFTRHFQYGRRGGSI